METNCCYGRVVKFFKNHFLEGIFSMLANTGFGYERMTVCVDEPEWKDKAK
jgi:hypothetical protein